MTKTMTSTIAAALIASAAFGSAALAAGSYQQGNTQAPANSAAVDHTQTNSIDNRGYVVHQRGYSEDYGQKTINRGDYYEGAQRPN